MKPRVYRFPLAKHCEVNCSYCDGIGMRTKADREIKDARQSAVKASTGPYGEVLLPCNFWFIDNKKEFIHEFQRRDLPLVVQINLQENFSDKFDEWLDFAKANKLKVSFIFDSWDAKYALVLKKAFGQIAWTTFLVKRGNSIVDSLRRMPAELRNKLYFQFPYNFADPKQYYSPREIHGLIVHLRAEFEDLIVRPMPGMENFDPRIPEDRNLEPMIEPEAKVIKESILSLGEVQISIVIPSYNNWIYLQNVLKHILAQDFPRENIETIIVDDGSNDSTRTGIREFFRNIRGEANVSYIYFPRSKPRVMGDDQFRAGVARNLGVKQAKGRILLFLDSDILLPRNYLATILRKHRDYELIQAKRIQLNRRASTQFTRYEGIVKSRDTYLTDAGYWHEFQTKTKNWMDLDRPWRFTCTYALSVTRDAFERIGWIRKNYIHYGYEDTELGFELYQAGCRFLLSDLEVYHLEHRRSRSEFFHSFRRKKLLLGKSAGTFFHNTLDLGVYRHLEWLFQPALALRLWAVDFAPKRLLQFWRRRSCAD